MRKSIVFALIAVIFIACSTSEPEQNKLIGTWSEPLGVQASVNALIFSADGIAVYANIPDTTMLVSHTGGITYGQMNYVVEKNRLCFSGNGIKYSEIGLPVDTVPFEYYTTFSILENKLVIDSFSYDGGIMTEYIKPLILYKQ